MRSLDTGSDPGVLAGASRSGSGDPDETRCLMYPLRPKYLDYRPYPDPYERVEPTGGAVFGIVVWFTNTHE